MYEISLTTEVRFVDWFLEKYPNVGTACIRDLNLVMRKSSWWRHQIETGVYMENRDHRYITVEYNTIIEEEM